MTSERAAPSWTALSARSSHRLRNFLPRSATCAPRLGAIVCFAVLVAGGARADVQLTRDCEPNGMIASARARFSPEGFWKDQLDAIAAEIAYQRSLPEKMREWEMKAEAVVAESRADLQELCPDYPDLEWCRPPTRAEVLREMADEAERAETKALLEKFRIERIAGLERCEGVVRDRLGLRRRSSRPPPAPRPLHQSTVRREGVPIADLRARRTAVTFYLVDRSILPPEGVRVDRSGMRPSFRQDFALPHDCGILEEYIGYYQRDGIWQNNAEHAELLSSQRFCRKWQTLNRNPATNVRDHVSGLSFLDLDLRLVPHEIECAGVSSRGWGEYCSRVARADRGVCRGTASSVPDLNYVAFRAGTRIDSDYENWLDCRPVRIDSRACKMSDGAFAGDIREVAGRIVCSPSAEAEGIELYEKAFGDVDGDGFLDVMMSVRGTSRGSGSVVFVLTRRSANGPIEVVPFD